MASFTRRYNPAYVVAAPVPTGALQYSLNEDGIALVEDMARNGHGNDTICKTLGISGHAFIGIRKRQPEVVDALNAGVGGLQDELVTLLLKQAREGNVVSAIFLAKARCGLRDVGPAPDAQTVPTVAIQINAPLTDDQFNKMITINAPTPPLLTDERPTDD